MEILVKTMMSSKYLTFVKCKIQNFNIEEASVSEMGGVQSIRLPTALDPLGHNDDIQDDNDDPTGSNDNFWKVFLFSLLGFEFVPLPLIPLLLQLVMEEPEKEADPNFEAFFADAPYLLQEEGEGAPPPFSLPPPPRPPWLEEETCTESSPIETCDNIIIIDSQVHLEETFQNLIIIAVCSALLVIMLVFSVACIWR